MSAPLAALSGLAWVYEQIETRLLAMPAPTPKLIDRIDPLNANPEHIAHMGIAVEIPSTENRGEYRDDDYALAHDTVSVSLTYRIRPHEQRNSRREAIQLEERIRAWLVAGSWMRDMRLSYVGTPTRSPHPKSSEFYLIVQTFRTARDAALGD